MEYLIWTHATRGGFQWLRFYEPPSRHTTEHDIQDVQSLEGDEMQPVKRLDGEVTRLEDMAFAGGTYCEVWVGQWARGGGEVEKVSMSLTTSILLTKLFVGSLENTSHTQITREDA